MLRRKEVKKVATGMAENRDLKDNIMLEEGLSTKGDSEKSPEMKELKILKEKEAEEQTI